jgi:hypothetical protein
MSCSIFGRSFMWYWSLIHAVSGRSFMRYYRPFSTKVFPHLHTCVVYNAQTCRGVYGRDLSLSPLVWQTRSSRRFAFATPPPPQGVGEAVGYAHGRGHACQGLRRFAKSPLTRAHCSRTTVANCAGRGSGRLRPPLKAFSGQKK